MAVSQGIKNRYKGITLGNWISIRNLRVCKQMFLKNIMTERKLGNFSFQISEMYQG
jgi:hypothetical protein